LRGGCDFKAFWGWAWGAKWRKRWALGTIRGSHFYPKIDNNTIQNSFKNQSRKNMENNTKRLPTWSQNRCRNSSRINAKTGTEKDQEIQQKSCFSEVWKHANSL
jgi:hypothetical protein